jgi:hypothetical protein
MLLEESHLVKMTDYMVHATTLFAYPLNLIGRYVCIRITGHYQPFLGLTDV